MKRAVVLGAGGFIGGHLVRRLKGEGYHVLGADLKLPEYSKTVADMFFHGDLRDASFVEQCIPEETDEVYQLAADMGGAGYIFTGENDAHVMHNSALINLHVANECVKKRVGCVFYSSSACVYPERNQLDPDNPRCEESSVYPAEPDSEYGWEKLFSERLYLTFARNHGLSVRIARFHNIYGPEGAWNNGKEKAPAAICRKVAEAGDNGTVEIWGDGKQTRSFLFIDDCLDAVRLMMQGDFVGPVNIGSEEMISINDFTRLIAKVSGRSVNIKNISGPTGVRGRSSDNELIRERLGWNPKISLEEGIILTYRWIEKNVKALNRKSRVY
ncbi:MAG: NAD-dependent epimerase/dehydratase family protein [Flavobacteriales bacterium]|nr:NAD-dependent epimerase/dehydratase family protein [Flavobacteriales bacterium]